MHARTRWRNQGFGAAVLMLAAAACVGGDHADRRDPVPLYDNLGNHHVSITTASSGAQAYFDQGLRLQYAFNHAEAIRSYEAALEADTGCAMCRWGIALAAGPNINAPMTEDGGRQAYAAVREAAVRTAGVTALERALIEALSMRYGPDPSAGRESLDSAYARAMAVVADSFPDESDVLTLYGSALMNLSPWNYWDGAYGARTARDGTDQIVAVLEHAVELAPDNPGACHYFIHLMEAAHPDRAVACAERLAQLMPGAGHIVHMPGHIYIRVGRYADAVTVNEHAVHSDETYMADRMMNSLYTGAYYPHNYHFMAFAATMAGMSGKALEAARAVAPKVPHDVARDVYWIQNAVVLPQLTLLTFGRWREVLAEPIPPADLEQASILARYARGVAFAATGDTAAARAALDTVRALSARMEGESDSNPIPHITPHVLAGEIALRAGDAETAVTEFRAAVEIEDSLLYDEPPLWYYPIRQSLGRALLEAGRPVEAEREYRLDLDRFPENGWSLHGLAAALEAQGRTEDARSVGARFRNAWSHADVELPASRF